MRINKGVHLRLLILVFMCFMASNLLSQQNQTVQVLAQSQDDSKSEANDTSDFKHKDFTSIDKYIAVKGDQVFLDYGDDSKYLFPNPKILKELASTNSNKSNFSIIMKYMDEFEFQFLQDKKIDVSLSPLKNIKSRIKLKYSVSSKQMPIEFAIHDVRYSLMSSIVRNSWAITILQEFSQLKLTVQNNVKVEPEKIRMAKFNLTQKENLPITIPLFFSLIMNFVCIYLIISKT